MPVKTMIAVVALLAPLLSGCTSGSGDPVQPVPGSGGEVVADYPEGPYGTQVGRTIQPFCFKGYVNPATGTGEANRADICLQEMFNPTGDGVYQADSAFGEGNPKPLVVMINIAAVWCQPCKEEASTILPAEYDQYGPLGLELVSVLTDSEDPGTAADFDNLDAWVGAFDSDYPSVIDPQYVIGTLIDTSQYPANFLVDTSNMTITEVVIGKPQDSFFFKLEELLKADE